MLLWCWYSNSLVECSAFGACTSACSIPSSSRLTAIHSDSRMFAAVGVGFAGGYGKRVSVGLRPSASKSLVKGGDVRVWEYGGWRLEIGSGGFSMDWTGRFSWDEHEREGEGDSWVESKSESGGGYFVDSCSIHNVTSIGGVGGGG
ncbi:hypothetical protein EX30DRAFT_200164 [Ascodesmis nigricans]|uniref:Uncharacterized protein n=1 Tax=Ascodesmis nigricans TaxID=341454 RepID=A0A4S2MQ53_9PEZI|nr:hypothetical protein EX30DRAFT_200164 [Ascodesmis nigricans]